MTNNKQQLELFKVRDLRKKDQFKIDDAYLNGYARVYKPTATAVYSSLCRHAEFNTQKAFPSQSLIAYQHDISVATVKRALKTLSKYNIIIIDQEKMKGKFKNNVYTLLDKSEWKKINRSSLVTHGNNRSSFAVAHLTTTVKCPTKDNKVFKDYTYKKDYKDNTPKNFSELFFTKQKEFNNLLTEFSTALNIEINKLEDEFNHFILYWTEPNKSGSKVRWELQKTFDVKRRLYTWLRNKQIWAREKQNNKRKEIIGL